jgi:hypothetical protein
MGFLSDAFFGKKKSTPSAHYVTPDFSYYAEKLPKVQLEANYAPKVNLEIGGYTPYGKIQDVRDSGQGYTEYDLRKVLDPTISWQGEVLSPDEDWEKKRRAAIWLGKMEGSNKDPVELVKQKAIESGVYSEQENLADEIIKGYYVPYEMALGAHYGRGSEVYDNPAPTHAEMIGDFYSNSPDGIFPDDWLSNIDLSGYSPLRSDPSLSTYSNPDWALSKRYDLSNTGPLLQASLALNPTLRDTDTWDWINEDFVDPNYGYFTQEMPSDWKYGFNEDYTPSKEYRQGGIAGPLGSILAFTPLAPIGYALMAANAVAQDNPVALATAAAGAFLPGAGELFPSLSPAAQAAVSGATIGGATAGLSGGNIGKGALQGGLTGYIGGSLANNQYLPKGTTGARYVNPAINRTLTSAAVAGLMGKDAEEAAKNSLTRSAWTTAGRAGGQVIKNAWNQRT